MRSPATERGLGPLAVAAGILVAAACVVPFSGLMGPVAPGFSALWCAAVLICDLLTVSLLLARFRGGGDPRHLVLALAYAVSGVTVAMLSVALPGVLSATPRFASADNAQGWLWLCRHVVPPVLIALALVPWSKRFEEGWRLRDRRHAAWLAVTGTLAVGPGLLCVVLLAAPERLPALMDPGTMVFRPVVVIVVMLLNLAVVGVATWGVIRRGSLHGLETWAVVAAVAWLGDVGLTFLHEDRFTVAFYAARLLGVSSSLIVLGAMFGETARMQSRVMAGATDLEEQVTTLLSAARQRDDIIAVVSHEMRAPLAGLQGYLEIMVEDDVEPSRLEIMHRRSWVLARRLTLLSEDLLAAATLPHGDLIVVPEDLDVAEQVAESRACFTTLDIRVTCPPGLRVHADPLRLQQILSNLIRNAEKHGAEPVLLEIRDEGDWIRFRVSDQGPGVNHLFVPHLFERFTRDSTVRSPGAGLGLSVVRELVNAHGGGVGYEVTGSSFFFTLPAAAAVVEREAAGDRDPGLTATRSPSSADRASAGIHAQRAGSAST